MSFLNLEACTNLMRGYTKKLCADRHTPYQVYHNLVYRMLKSTHNGAYSMVYNFALKIPLFEVVVR